MSISQTLPVIIWGFLIGFVGWGSLFRLVQPITEWLLVPASKSGFLGQMIVQLVVVLFLIAALISTISILPMFLANSGRWLGLSEPLVFKNLLGVAFLSSWAGFFSLAAIQKFL